MLVHITILPHTFSATSPKGQCRIYLILDLDEGIQHHWSTRVQVYPVFLHPGFVSRLVWVLGGGDKMIT